MKITILGARGSIPIEGKKFLEFGGLTSCVLCETKTEAVFIDAGTGLLNAPIITDKNVSMLLTHPHLDHLIGLPFFPLLSKKNQIIDFYAGTHEGLNAEKLLDGLFSPPYWPCKISDYPADFRCHELSLPLQIGDVTIEAIKSNHPGESFIFKVTSEGKSFVYATDYEYKQESAKDLIDFSRNADLLCFDSQYTDEEYLSKKGYGHSTISQGMEIFKESKAKSMRFVHHNPSYDDEFLRSLEKNIKDENVSIARINEVITL
jgi:ribonuclease BN (tRNA processing enzyme)